MPGLDLAPLLRSLSSIFLFWAARFCLCFSSISRLCWSSLCCLMLADGMFSILTTVNNINFYQDLTMKHQTLIFYTDKSRSILRMCLLKKTSALVSHLPSNHRNTEINMQKKKTKNVKWNGKGDNTDLQATHRTQTQAEMRDEEDQTVDHENLLFTGSRLWWQQLRIPDLARHDYQDTLYFSNII